MKKIYFCKERSSSLSYLTKCRQLVHRVSTDHGHYDACAFAIMAPLHPALFFEIHSSKIYSSTGSMMSILAEKILYITKTHPQFIGHNSSSNPPIASHHLGPKTPPPFLVHHPQEVYRERRFQRLRHPSRGIFYVEEAPRTGRHVVENIDKITEIIEVDRHVSSRSIAQELKIDHKTVLSHLPKVGLKKKLHVWVPHQLTPKHMMDRISICEILAKRNEIDSFLKRMKTGDEKWVTYYNIVQKRLWPKCGEAAQPGLTARKVLLCIWWDWKGIIYYEFLPYGQTLNLISYC
ncbi:histone-lysine N-methyltransferase SETMAR [Trichonephila clavipes]|nr:histone-lysine N-methyltransferase SETMAR [Trichonephila clavipes]